MKFAVALLIGVISATKVENFSELAPHSYIESPNNLVQQAAESESESSDSDEEDIQTQFDTFPVAYHGTHFYERVLPERFSKDTDDIFMRSMIKTYAHEEKSKVVEHDDGTKTGGEPTGKFWMNKEDALSAAKEVLGTHKGLAGAALDQYIATFFDKAWGHFDVNKTGWIEVIKMPQFCRFLASDQWMSLKESG